MASFTCPFCNCNVAIDNQSHAEYHLPEHYSTLGKLHNGSPVIVELFRCTNCNRMMYTAHRDSSIDSFNTMIYPQAIYKSYPAYIPEAIRTDYEEACKIRTLSPKASATLCRRCLQGMLRDFWEVKPGRLSDEISSVKDRLSASQWSAIDSLRQIGNIGAHMENDVNLIVDVDPGEADMLIRLIERLVEGWYIARHSDQELYSQIVDLNSEKQVERKKSI